MMYLWLSLALAACLAVYWLYWRYQNRHLLRLAAKIPTPPTVPGLGNALIFAQHSDDLLNVFGKLMAKYGDVLGFWLGPDFNVVVGNPDDLKSLLTSPKTSVKGPSYKYMADVLGGGILSGSGTPWKLHRKIVSTIYAKKAIENYSPVFNHEVDMMIKRLHERTEEYDIYEDVVWMTSLSVCQTIMKMTREETLNLPNLKKLIEVTHDMYDVVFSRMTKWWHQIDPVFYCLNAYWRQRNFIKNMFEFGGAIIEIRKKELEEMTNKHIGEVFDLDEDSLRNRELGAVDRFLVSGELNHNEMVEEIYTLFTSSQEASAKIASYALLMMAYHPECQAKLYAEVSSVIGPVDRHVDAEDLKKMPYLEMVFKECARLFPIGAMIQRTVTEDFEIGPYTLPAGCALLAPIFQMHRDPRFWTRPNDFDPERFTPENIKLRHPNCYMPFSAGPMDCLGRYFGTTLIKTACARVLREFKLTSSGTYRDMKLHSAVSVTLREGYKVTLTPRTKTTLI